MRFKRPHSEQHQMIWSLIVASVIGIIIWFEVLNPPSVLGVLDESSEITRPKLQ